MQKFEKSEGNYSNAQFLNRKPLKIARYSCDIFGPNLALFCNSEVDIYNRNQVIIKVKNTMIKEIVNSIYSISDHSLKELENLVEYKNYEKGETFIQKGKHNSKEYFVIDGICRSFLLNPEGEEITISFFTSNTILSPYTTRTINGFSNLNFQASTTTKLAAIDASKFEQLMIDNIEIRNFGNTVLRNELKAKVNKEIGLAALTAKERLIEFRKQYPLLENLIPHTEIATYLGITNISLSRLRREIIK